MIKEGANREPLLKYNYLMTLLKIGNKNIIKQEAIGGQFRVF